MAIVCLSSETGCPLEETARLAAVRLQFELITEFHLAKAFEDEFGATTDIPDRAWLQAVEAVLARLAAEHHLVLAFPGCEHTMRGVRGTLRLRLVASEARRSGNFMLDFQLDRAAARRKLASAERKQAALLAARIGPSLNAEPGTPSTSHDFDLVLNMTDWLPDEAASVISAAASARRITDHGFFTGGPAAQFEFETRLALAAHGIAPRGKAGIRSTVFSHPSEELFANLLDFYRIDWRYEARSFPLQWNSAGEVTEAFTPDFYLPECDLYIELTTMKQALVTRKNRKVKRLKAIYPHIQIQIFYQKDFQDLVFKHGIANRIGNS